MKKFIETGIIFIIAVLAVVYGWVQMYKDTSDTIEMWKSVFTFFVN